MLYKEISKLKFIQICFFIEQSYLLCNTVLAFAILATAFTLLKTNARKATELFAFTFFLLHVFKFGNANGYSGCFISVILLSSDIEVNPGTGYNSYKSFPICHWNLNSLTDNNGTVLSLLRAYISTHKFDIICFSETTSRS